MGEIRYRFRTSNLSRLYDKPFSCLLFPAGQNLAPTTEGWSHVDSRS